MLATDMQYSPSHHSYLEAGNDTATALLGMLGSVGQLLHHAYDLDRGPGVPTLLEAEGEVTEVTRGMGGD